MNLHLIYTETSVLLSKRLYQSWREIQAEITGYKASLGPWSAEEMATYLHDEYTRLVPTAAQQVASFVASDSMLKEVTFHGYQHVV